MNLITNIKELFLKRKKRFIFFITLTCIFLSLLGSWVYSLLSPPKPIIYYQSTFAEGITNWEAFDATWIPEYSNQKGVVKLTRQNFMSPHLMTSIPLDQSPSETLVLYIRVRVNSYSDKAITLGSLYFPTGPLSIVSNKENKLGLADNLFEPAIYSHAFLSNIKKGEWEDIYIKVDGLEKRVTLYQDGRQILTKPWIGSTYPVEEIWLGSIWYKGSEDYGSPIDIAYDQVSLGNEGILPKPNFLEFVQNHYYMLLDWLISKLNDGSG